MMGGIVYYLYLLSFAIRNFHKRFLSKSGFYLLKNSIYSVFQIFHPELYILTITISIYK